MNLLFSSKYPSASHISTSHMQLTKIVCAASVLSTVFAAPTSNDRFAKGKHHSHKKVDKRDVVVSAVLLNNNQGVPELTGEQTTAAVVGSVASAASDSNGVAASSAAVTTTLQPSSTQLNQAAIVASASSSQAAAQSSSTSNSSSSSSTGNAGAKGITYSPYSNNGGCKSASEVASDLAALQDFSIIRLYGVDCSQVENVLQAKTSNQKLFLGIYYMDQIQDGVNTISSAVSSHGSWDDIDTIAIGNELVNSGDATAAQVGQYVSEGRTALQSAGYNGKIVSVDTFVAVINNPELCNYSDYIAVNAHAYFDYNTPASNAGPWVLSQIQRVWNACGGQKNVLITESGWPTQGETYGQAVPSVENQKIAIQSIKDSCGSATILFTAYNDYWKDAGAYGVEKYWGIYSN